MAEVQCKVETAEMKGPLGVSAAEPLTVGHEFALICEGEWPTLNLDKIELRLEEQDKYKLKLIKIQQDSAGKASLLVTSYVPGDHQLKAVQIVDDEKSVLLGDLSFTVKSVINPQEAKQEPYGPMGPLVMSLSWYFWLSLVLIVAGVVLLIWTLMRRRLQRQKLLEEMSVHDSALSPVAEFSKGIRILQRDLNPEKLVEINKIFRIYLARKFQIPTLVWSDKLILKDFKKRFPELYKQYGSVLIKTIFEISRALKKTEQVKDNDLEQYIDLARRCVDALEKGEKS